MNRFKNHLIVAAVLGALALTGIVMNSRQAVAQGPSGPVHVTVEAPLPLPVTGPVTLSGPVDSPDTVLVLDQQVTVAGTSTPPVGPIDVSGFKEIRVVVYAPFVAFGVGIQPLIINPNDQTQEAVLDSLILPTGLGGIKVYDAIFKKMEFALITLSPGTVAVRLQVYGRNN